MNTDNLITLADFAKESGLRQDQVTRLITPQQIIVEEIGGRKFIDKVKYPPKNYTL